MFDDNKTDFQRYMDELAEAKERRKLAKLQQKYPTMPNFDGMSLPEELNARYDWDELNQLKQKYATQPKINSTDSKNILDELVERLASPSVQTAYAKAKEYSKKKYNHISDADKHQYISCMGATDGLLATAETLVGAMIKEGKDIRKKLTTPIEKAKYGGTLGVLGDSVKDMGNNLIGSAHGLASAYGILPDDYCEVVYGRPFRNKIY